MAPAENITPKGFRTVARLNVEGTRAMCDAVAAKAMLPQGSGTIVNVTLSPHHGLAGMAHSSSARAAVEGLTEQLAAEWGPSGVSVIALAAGHFATETLRTKYPKVIVDGVARTVPLQRLGTEEEFGWTVALLASPAGAALSGSVLTIDGARDNNFGPWPPPGATDESGSPPAEERRARG
jgi:citronellol/citronellal dehydrogenase